MANARDGCKSCPRKATSARLGNARWPRSTCPGPCPRSFCSPYATTLIDKRPRDSFSPACPRGRRHRSNSSSLPPNNRVVGSARYELDSAMERPRSFRLPEHGARDHGDGLDANSIVLLQPDYNVVVNTGYSSHADQTLALVRQPERLANKPAACGQHPLP